MLANGSKGTGISAHRRAPDLSDFGAEIDMIEALGVDSIEIPIFDLDLIVGGKIRRPQMDALKRAAAGRGVSYSVHGPLAINFMDEPYRLPRHFEVLQASLDITAELGAEHYVIHSGLARTQQAGGVESRLDQQREWLGRAGDLARQRGIVLCVETLFGDHDGSTLATAPARLATELAAIGHPNVMATIDFSHSWIKLDYDGRKRDYVAEIAQLAPYARHLHIQDSFGRQDDVWMFTEGERLAYGHGDLHLPVGWGDIPWDALLDACTFPAGVLFNIELNLRYWHAAQECVDATKAMAERAKVSRAAAAA